MQRELVADGVLVTLGAEFEQHLILGTGIFALQLAANSQQEIYLRVESSIGLLVPLQLWTVEGFQAYAREDYMARAGYMGIAVAMILFNLMLFIALRERIYLLYVTFVLCAVCALTIKNGMAPDWTLFGLPLNSNVAYYSGASLALSSMLLFMRSMLQTARLLPRVDRWLRATAWAWLAVLASLPRPAQAIALGDEPDLLNFLVTGTRH